jgi:hypothetical protein
MGYRTGSKQPSGVNDLLRPWTNRFLPSKRLAQAMNNWHGSNIQAGRLESLLARSESPLRMLLSFVQNYLK